MFQIWNANKSVTKNNSVATPGGHELVLGLLF